MMERGNWREGRRGRERIYVLKVEIVITDVG